MPELKLPSGFDWQHWVDRWERMQDRYLVRRSERFATITRLVSEGLSPVHRVLSLGCGPGSLMLAVLEACPGMQVYGVDFDPIILLLARERLARFGNRVGLTLADLREASWARDLPRPMDAVVSATALHWLLPDQLVVLYSQIAHLLRPGGLFVNADHVGSDDPSIQRMWERHREEMCLEEGKANADEWETFWEAYAGALGVEATQVHRSAMANWEGGVEEGMPLAWHLDKLREAGFRSVDCFWRCDCDAIYGGVKDGNGT
jgi:SAM-dependent methyltransferase